MSLFLYIGVMSFVCLIIHREGARSAQLTDSNLELARKVFDTESRLRELRTAYRLTG